MYNKAKELGCNKIALGHHYDDVIETILLSMIYGAEIKTMMPKLHSTNFPGMELIRPMYLIKEEDIIIKKGEAIGQGIFQKYLVTDDDRAEGERLGGFGSTTK